MFKHGGESKEEAMLSTRKVIGIKPLNNKSVSSDIKEVPEKDLKTLYDEAERMLEEAEARIKHAEAEVNDIREKADREIEQKKEAWQSEKEKLSEQAQQQGYQAGYQKGQEEAQLNYQNIIEEAYEIIALAKKDYDKTVAQSEETILAIGLNAANKILDYTLSENEEIFINIVRKALREVNEQPHIVLYVHPDHYHFVLSQKDELLNIIKADADLSIYPKVELNSNSCYVESPFGRIDASIDTQLLELRKKLFDLLEEAKSIEHSESY